MSGPEGERSAGGRAEGPQPFVVAARFNGEAPAGRAYFRVQDAVYASPQTELSVYRFQLSRIYHVAVLGEQPPLSLEQRLRKLLSVGHFVDLPEDVTRMLLERREAAKPHGSWLEGHYRPGLPL